MPDQAACVCAVMQEWRDAYSLYTLLTVTANLAGQHQRPSAPQHAQQHQQQHQEQEQEQQQLALPSSQQLQEQEQLLREALRQLDLAALMGGLRFRPLVDKFIDTLDSHLQHLQGVPASGAAAEATILSLGDQSQAYGRQVSSPSMRAQQHKRRAKGDAGGEEEAPQVHDAAAQAAEVLFMKQQRLAPQQQQQLHADAPQAACKDTATVAAAGAEAGDLALPPGSLTSTSAVVPVELAPSMEHFLVHHLLSQGSFVLGMVLRLVGVLAAHHVHALLDCKRHQSLQPNMSAVQALRQHSVSQLHCHPCCLPV